MAERQYLVRPDVRHADSADNAGLKSWWRAASKTLGMDPENAGLIVLADDADDAVRKAAEGKKCDPHQLEAIPLKGSGDLAETPPARLEELERRLAMLAEKVAQSKGAEDFLTKKIPYLIKKEGYKPDQAKAIAISMARKAGYKMAPEKSSKK